MLWVWAVPYPPPKCLYYLIRRLSQYERAFSFRSEIRRPCGYRATNGARVLFASPSGSAALHTPTLVATVMRLNRAALRRDPEHPEALRALLLVEAVQRGPRRVVERLVFAVLVLPLACLGGLRRTQGDPFSGIRQRSRPDGHKTPHGAIRFPQPCRHCSCLSSCGWWPRTRCRPLRR